MRANNDKPQLRNINKFWHPINIYNNLKSLYFSIIPKGSKAYNFTYGFLRLFLKQFQIFNIYYREWIRRVDTYTDAELESFHERINQMDQTPYISVVMPVYNPPIQLLQEAIESVRKQVYPYWELCIADDASTDLRITQLLQQYAQSDQRIKLVLRKENGHISAASNTALGLATHEFIALLDHDDLLHPLALYYVAQTIRAHPDCQIIYTDEDKITRRGKRLDPYFKPEFDYELILSHNMISHLGVYRLSTVRSVGGFRLGLEGSQDYDLFLRVLEKCTSDQIIHIPFPLYHWRISSQSAAENVNKKPYAINAAERALSEHHQRMNVLAKISFLPEITAFQTVYTLPVELPDVEIILPDFYGDIRQENYLTSLVENTGYQHLNVCIINNNDDHTELKHLYKDHLSLESLQVRSISGKEKLATTLNNCVSASTADYLIFLNQPLTGFQPGWLNRLLGQAYQSGIGAVSPKILYASGEIYFNGIILKPDPLFNFLYNRCSNSENGYFGWAKVKRGYSTLSDTFFAVKRKHILDVNGFDEIYSNPFITVVDFLLKLKEFGLRNVLIPSVQLFLPSEGEPSFNGNNAQLQEKELIEFQTRWDKYIHNDPSFNPNLAMFTENRIIVNTMPQLKLPGD